MDTESAAWVRGLAAAGGDNGDDRDALTRLHALLLRGARAEANRRGARLGLVGPDLDDLAHQAADDACLAVVRKLGQFRGESRFTTWAYTFVVLEVSSKVARHTWGERSVPFEAADWERLPDRLGVDPAVSVEAAELATAVRRAVAEELTAHQRRVFSALVLAGTPLDVVVAELGTTRGAVYKAMFDARRKIRAFLVANEFLTEGQPTEGQPRTAGGSA